MKVTEKSTTYQNKELSSIIEEQIIVNNMIIKLRNNDILSGVFKRIIYISNL